MSVKVKNTIKNLIMVLSLPFFLVISSYFIEFIMQLGRLVGTLIRIIMSL